MNDPFLGAELPSEIAEVNVVPLADVSLVLLIILLVLSPMMTQSALRVRTAAEKAPAAGPEEPAPAPAPEPARLVLVVALGQDSVSVGERRFVGAAELMAFLAAEIAAREDKKVFLAPAPEVPHGKVVHMLETLKQVGASSVALVQTAEAPQ